jgi:hypothetical protein
MIWRRRVSAMIGLTATAALITVAGPASATGTQQTHTQVTRHEAVVTTKVTMSTPTLSSASSGCRTYTYTATLNDAPLGWPEDAWYRMDTYFCWNGSIVTYHYTTTSGGTTKYGAAGGWHFDREGDLGFHCYVAVGSHRNCSGNTEFRQAHFSECLLKIGCVGGWDPQIQEWENYHGGAGIW